MLYLCVGALFKVPHAHIHAVGSSSHLNSCGELMLLESDRFRRTDQKRQNTKVYFIKTIYILYLWLVRI